VPSLGDDAEEGATSRTYRLLEAMKSVWSGCNSLTRSAPHLYEMMMCSAPRGNVRTGDQQNSIDKAKGIIAQPMPPSWYDHHAISRVEGIDERMYHNIAADRKPYFMRYVYPALNKQYNNYIKNAGKNAVREFGLTLDELLAVPSDDRTDRQNEFVEYYERFLPVGTGDCVMNRICRRFEEKFDGYLSKHRHDDAFDYTIMKSGAEYTPYMFRRVSELHTEYNQRVANYTVFQQYERVDEFEAAQKDKEILDDFMRACSEVCPNRFVLCDILLDVCYRRGKTKKSAKLVWDVCGDEIIANLLRRNGGVIRYPERDENGDICYCGERFTQKTCIVEENDGTGNE